MSHEGTDIESQKQLKRCYRQLITRLVIRGTNLLSTSFKNPSKGVVNNVPQVAYRSSLATVAICMIIYFSSRKNTQIAYPFGGVLGVKMT